MPRMGSLDGKILRYATTSICPIGADGRHTNVPYIFIKRIIRHSPDDFQAEEIVPPFPRKKNGIPTASIRWPYFGDQSSFYWPLAQISHHSDTLLLSLSPGRRFPRPTPERVFVVDHQSGSGFSETVLSARQPRLIGT